MANFGYRKPRDLPATLAVFPLPGALLFPRSTLPLNIFEPRYLNMVDDALAGDRLIGMIQPVTGAGISMAAVQAQSPGLFQIGCAGRITSFAETEDGRYLITLTGICRFRVEEELPQTRPYRVVQPDFEAFAADLSPSQDLDVDRIRLRAALEHYVAAKGFAANWGEADQMASEALVHLLAASLPLQPMDKQAILEAESLADRCDMLVALLELHAAGGDQSGQNMQ